MSDLFYLPNFQTRGYYHEAVQAYVEDLRIIYMAEILCKARDVLSQLHASDIEPDALIDTVAFVGKESRKTVERTDACWIITETPVDRKERCKINSPRISTPKKVGNVALLTVAKKGFVLIESGKIILPFSSLSLVGTTANLQYLKDHHEPNFVTDENIGKDGYVDTGLIPGLDRLSQRAS